MSEAFDALWEQTRGAFAQERTWRRARTLALGALVGLGRRTVTGMLCASAQQGADWSGAYRLFERGRFETGALFAPARRAVCAALGEGEPLTVLLDDTLVRKRGRKVHGAGWRRDPLGPAFHTNLVWGQRFVQLSAALPEGPGPRRARGVPVDLCHCPSPKKPRRNAPACEWRAFRRLRETMKVAAVGAARLHKLRAALDAEPAGAGREVIVALDGAFTNRTVLRSLPHKTAAVGRIRKDARLFLPPGPPQAPRRGRPRWYGAPLPPPEQIRQDPAVPWQSAWAWCAGGVHRFEVKTLPAVRWSATGDKDVRLVVVRPVAYRPRKGAPLLYRKPLYLVCTGTALPLGRVLQAFLWRWEIELNFRDEKTLLGVGQAQVRTRAAAQAVPCFLVAAYAFLLLAAARAGGASTALPPPKWQRRTPAGRTSTARLIGALRAHLWGKAMGVNLTRFVQRPQDNTNSDQIASALPSAVCYAFR